jgi:hypothetical protein
MSTEPSAESFPLARMSPQILWLTVFLLALPVVFLSVTLFVTCILALPTAFMVGLYTWVWLRYRPSRFAVHPDRLEVIWPLKRLAITRSEISAVRIVDAAELRHEIGWGMRVGVGGLWGAFGSLWTQRRGRVRMYVSRTDRFVWIELASGQPWLVTPERPDAFLRALSPGH